MTALTIEQSLESVHRQLRRLRLFTALLGLAFVLSVLMPIGEVRASRFVLIDDLGQQRGILRVHEGVPGLLLQDAAGSWRAVLSVVNEKSLLQLMRSNGEAGITMVAGEGLSSLTLYGEGARAERIELRTTPDGPAVVLPDQR